MIDSKVPRSAARKPPGGSRKGKPNKATKELKEMILGALDGAGGQAYLQTQADKNPVAFMTLIGKVLPLQLDAKGSFNGKFVIEWKSDASS
jgi:hypothetical protein